MPGPTSIVRAAAVALLSAAGAHAHNHDMRPAHTTSLSADTFDGWVKDAVKNKKTAFVRWMALESNEGDCSWVTAGFSGLRYDEIIDEEDGPMTDPETDPLAAHHEQLQKDLKHDPCAVARAQATAWNTVTQLYKNDPAVVFGDVIVADNLALAGELKDKYVQEEDKSEDDKQSAQVWPTLVRPQATHHRPIT
jgi:hypothetical protein